MEVNTYLKHHGIQGQKWGVRRYQNTDGSYKTGAEGRYYDKTNNVKEAYQKVYKDYKDNSKYSSNSRKMLRNIGKFKSIIEDKDIDAVQKIANEYKEKYKEYFDSKGFKKENVKFEEIIKNREITEFLEKIINAHNKIGSVTNADLIDWNKYDEDAKYRKYVNEKLK